MSEEISLVEAYKKYEDDRELDYQDDEVILIMNKNKEMTHLNEFEHIKPRCKLFAALESLRIEAIIYEPKENYFAFVDNTKK